MMIIPNTRQCWCGNTDLLTFSNDYSQCSSCGTLVSLKGLESEKLQVLDDETDFYGKKYWLEHQSQDLDFPDIHKRSRNDLTERNLHWLKTLLKYCLPPAKTLELGCSHGSFVALLNQAGYDASGVEMSPWVIEFGQKTFGVPISVGPIEALDIAPGSLDVIALMDVLEHLPDPVATMAQCLKLLKSDGLLLIQMPQFKEGMNYTTLVETKGAFLEQLKSDEHLYLFTDHSATRLFQQLGAEHIQFEPAIFGHYDMFFAVSRTPLQANTPKQIESALLSTPKGRLALALMDIYDRELAAVAQLQADKAHLIAQLQISEADRSARLVVIESQGQQLGRIPQLEAENIKHTNQLQNYKTDNTHLVAQLQICEAERAALYANKWVQMGIKTKLIATKKP